MSDTLQLDSARLELFKGDSRYDYDRELVGGSQSLLEWIQQFIGELLSDLFDTVIDNDVVNAILIGGGIAVVLFLIWLYWRLRPKLFVRGEKEEAIDYDVQEDTIYGIDFDASISHALRDKDYRQAVRLTYLHTLKLLEDEGRIEWHPSKTPSQYMRQMNNVAFSEMSIQFIRVRYGNFEATESLYQRMHTLQGEVTKGGEP